MPFDTLTANAILNWALGKGSLANKSKVYIGLCTNDPEADGGTFNELSGDTYERVLISQYNQAIPDFIGSASGRQIYNQKQINWTKATQAWPAANGYGLFAEPSGGTPFYYAKLDLTEEQAAAGGVVVEARAIMLFDPQAMKISFTTTDVAASAAAVSE